jgi:peptide/nickel transport system permease protein
LVGGVVTAALGHPVLGAALVATGIAARVVAEVAGVSMLAAGPQVNVDALLMRLVDIGLSFPFLLLVMALGAALERISPASVVLVLGLTGWFQTARLVRAKTMQIRALDFVVAARAIGAPPPRILWRHVLPNVAGVLWALSTLSVAQMILAESALGYLGVGVAPPRPTWGRMLFEGQDYLLAGPWMVVAPAAAIVFAALGFHLLGEGLRDALDARV